MYQLKERCSDDIDAYRPSIVRANISNRTVLSLPHNRQGGESMGSFWGRSLLSAVGVGCRLQWANKYMKAAPDHGPRL